MIVRRAAAGSAAVYLVVTGMVPAFVLLLPAGAAPARAADPWTITQLANDRYMDFQLVAAGDRLAWSRALGVVWGLDDQEQGGREGHRSLFLRDLARAETILLAAGDVYDRAPSIDGDLVVWSESDCPRPSAGHSS